MATTTFSANYKWWVVFMVWFVCFFNYADRQAASSVLPLLSKDFGFDDFQLGIIGSAFSHFPTGSPATVDCVRAHGSQRTTSCRSFE